MRIVVIDDDVDAREILELLLNRHGANVATAHDGARGLVAAEAHAPHVVLCDLALPDMSGHEVVALLRERPAPVPRCIAVSGYPLPTEHAFDGYLRKPVDIHALVQMIALFAFSRAPNCCT